mgnify:CR=1 FL=1
MLLSFHDDRIGNIYDHDSPQCYVHHNILGIKSPTFDASYIIDIRWYRLAVSVLSINILNRQQNIIHLTVIISTQSGSKNID